MHASYDMPGPYHFNGYLNLLHGSSVEIYFERSVDNVIDMDECGSYDKYCIRFIQAAVVRQLFIFAPHAVGARL